MFTIKPEKSLVCHCQIPIFPDQLGTNAEFKHIKTRYDGCFSHELKPLEDLHW